MRKGYFRFIKNRNGSMAVETALALPVFLTFILGLMSFAHMFWVRNSIEYALERGGRYLMLNTSATQTEVQTQVRNRIYGFSSANVTVTLSAASACGSASCKTITATYSYAFFFGAFLKLSAITLTSTSQVPIS